jgi:cysteine desulfurase family protein (TIGR01976 family)
MSLDLPLIRAQFPSLNCPAIFLDNPGGTQVAGTVFNRISNYLTHINANHDGAFTTSRLSDALIEEARAAMADHLVASRPEEIVFGPNMTSLTFNLSRSLARTWKRDDEIVVTRLDHDANITPWILAAEECGCKVRWVDFNPEDGTLDLEDLKKALEGKPRLVAVGFASNALGTINPVNKIVQMAHSAGALVYVDAVQYAPHGPIDVQKLQCDFLVCSSYKFFGPHAGILYGRYELLDSLTAYKVRPAPKNPPGKFETGTGNHEGIAGILGAVEYLSWVGKTFGNELAEGLAGMDYTDRQLTLKLAMIAIRAYEFELSRSLLETLEETPGVQIYGLRDIQRLEERVPTFAFTMKGQHPRKVAEELDKANIYAWDGNYYALAVTERLDLEASGGMIRVGAVHYNTLAEIARLREVLGKISSG